MIDFVLKDVWLFCLFVYLFAFGFLFYFLRIILFSTGLQYLLSTIWTNGEPSAGHVTFVAPGDWSSSVLCGLRKQVSVFLKLLMKKCARC